MPISATAAFVVLRLWRVWGPAAAIGGLVYGFSTFAVGQSLAHPFLVFCPLPPFIAYTVASILPRRGSPVRLGIATGLLLGGQYLCSQEIFTMVVLLIGWALFCIAARYPRRIIEVARECRRLASSHSASWSSSSPTRCGCCSSVPSAMSGQRKDR